MQISITNNKNRIIVKSEILPAIKGIEIDYNKKIKSLGIVILSDEQLREINVKHLQSDYYTDIITFDYSENSNEIEGELCISHDRIIENAQKYKITEKEEIYRVIIHGILHLAGEDDLKKDQQKRMQDKENQYLKLICFT
jgi:probable rRNA maturation factor